MSKNRYSKIKKHRVKISYSANRLKFDQKKNDLNCTEFAINAINQQTRQCKKKIFEMWNDKNGHIIKKVWLFQEKKECQWKEL